MLRRQDIDDQEKYSPLTHQSRMTILLWRQLGHPGLLACLTVRFEACRHVGRSDDKTGFGRRNKGDGGICTIARHIMLPQGHEATNYRPKSALKYGLNNTNKSRKRQHMVSHRAKLSFSTQQAGGAFCFGSCM